MTAHPMTLSELLVHGHAALDGGLASELEARGHDLTGTLWSARLLADDPAAIRDVHTAYFLAGATVGISASYQASRAGFERHGLGADQADRLLSLSVSLVREARAVAAGEGSHHPMLVAASVGPYGATLHDGSEYRGRYGVSHDFLVDFHRERLEVLVHARPDFLAVETIPDVDEARAIVAALQELELAAWMSFSCVDSATTCAGQPIEVAAAVVAEAGLAAIGVNCTKPEFVLGLVQRIRAAQPGLPIVVYPNAGRVWDGEASVWLGDGTDLLPRAAVRAWFDAGASLVGGCCGLGPAAVADVVAVAALP
jgi:homocysteine S-methyltransferase